MRERGNMDNGHNGMVVDSEKSKCHVLRQQRPSGQRPFANILM